MPRLNTVVMVPKGAEFNAVMNGLNSAQLGPDERKSYEIVSLPVGPVPVQSFLNQWCQNRKLKEASEALHVVLMGLCGSLTEDLSVNDAVIYQRCFNGVAGNEFGPENQSYDFYTPSDYFSLKTVTPVTGVMCDRVISQVKEKRRLAQNFSAQVVDMEGLAAFQTLQKFDIQFSMIRIVSDNVFHDLPDLNAAFDRDGNIKPLIMARQFLLNPMGALRLIQGSLSSLKTLSQLAKQFFDARL